MRPWGRALVAGLVFALVVVGCTRPDRVDQGRPGQPTELRWRPAGDSVVCDGTERAAGTIEQAASGEAIEFTTALPIELADGRADDAGRSPLTWTCQPEEAQLRWSLTATGAESGRSVALTIVGAPAPSGAVAELTVSLHEDTLVCDGSQKEVGVVSGLRPRERVVFQSEQGGQANPQRADPFGDLVFTWSCRPGDVGRTWPATAEAEPSERSVSFQLRGLAAGDDLPLELRDASTEVLCDGRVQPLANLVNLFPFEVVTFMVEPPADDLRDGTASGDGTLDLRWQCDRDDAGQLWELTARATETDRAIRLTFSGLAAPVGDATVEPIEDPFVCDGERRPVALLRRFDPGEFVDFTSPQAENLLEGRAEDGSLEVNWQCGVEELDGVDQKVWVVTATGRESGTAVSFEIVGVLAP